MREMNYGDLLPDFGIIAILGNDIEEPLIRALAYRVAEGYSLGLVPLTPHQLDLALRLDIPIYRLYPDYLYLEVDKEPKEGFFTVGRASSPFVVRLVESVAEKTIVFLRGRYHTISVEVLPFLTDEIRPIVELYGDIVSERESPYGNVVLDIVPIEKDVEELRNLLKEVPGVVEVAIFPILAYRKIILRR